MLKGISNHQDSSGLEDTETTMTSVLVTAVSPITSISLGSQALLNVSDLDATQKPNDVEMMSIPNRPSSSTLRGSPYQTDTASTAPIMQNDGVRETTVPDAANPRGRRR